MTSVVQVHQKLVTATVVAVAGLWAFVPGVFASMSPSTETRLPATVVTTTEPSQATTTTTTLPSAVTTLPQGCALAPQALAVFLGTVLSTDPVNAVFSIVQLRAGSLEGYQENGNVSVRYGSDVKYLEVGESYIVGVAPDPISSRLFSRVKESAEIFGGAEIAGSNTRCPVFEDPVRTLTIDGRSINAGLFSQLFDEPWRIALAFVLPPLLVLLALFGVVWFRRGVGR